jgi:hypothetical protein
LVGLAVSPVEPISNRTLPARLSRRAALELVKFSLDCAATSALFVVIRLDL